MIKVFFAINNFASERKRRPRCDVHDRSYNNSPDSNSPEGSGEGDENDLHARFNCLLLVPYCCFFVLNIIYSDMMNRFLEHTHLPAVLPTMLVVSSLLKLQLLNLRFSN